MAFQLAIINGLKHPVNQEKSEAGKKWIRSFLKRHPVPSMRKPEAISSAREKGSISGNAVGFFDVCEPELKKLIIKATGYSLSMKQITAVQRRHSEVVSMRGNKLRL